MNGFQCNITNSVSDVPVAKSQVPRRCGADPDFGKQLPAPGNCTYGAKQPFYWFQAERNNVRWSLCIARAARGIDPFAQMFEGTYAPPFYTDLYNFKDGAQDDIFVDSYAEIPTPSANQTVVPTPLEPSSTSGATTSSSVPPSAPTSQPTNQAPFGTPPGRCHVW